MHTHLKTVKEKLKCPIREKVLTYRNFVLYSFKPQSGALIRQSIKDLLYEKNLYFKSYQFSSVAILSLNLLNKLVFKLKNKNRSNIYNSRSSSVHIRHMIRRYVTHFMHEKKRTRTFTRSKYKSHPSLSQIVCLILNAINCGEAL